MTEQHPLTDKICFNILSNKYDVSGLDWHKYQDEVDLMRAVADWQLEQVIEWIRDTHEEYIIKDLREAMRPTQENNNE